MRVRKERFACQKCPAFYECEKGNINATAGGWEKKVIDGREMICCRSFGLPGSRVYLVADGKGRDGKYGRDG